MGPVVVIDEPEDSKGASSIVPTGKPQAAQCFRCGNATATRNRSGKQSAAAVRCSPTGRRQLRMVVVVRPSETISHADTRIRTRGAVLPEDTMGCEFGDAYAAESLGRFVKSGR